MPGALFGPVFFVAALSVSHFVNNIYKTFVSIEKHGEKEKELMYGLNDVSAAIWACIRWRCSLCHTFC